MILLPILLLAGLLRFVHLSNRGFIYWDEAKFALEGVRLQSLLASGTVAGKAVGTAKPLHALLLAAAYALFGVHDYAALYLDAAASVVAVALTYLLGRSLLGHAAGLIGAAFLAVSGYDIVYARSALSESDADLLFLLGVFLWWRTHNRPAGRQWAAGYLASGLTLGAAFTANYRVLVYALAFGLAAATFMARTADLRRAGHSLLLGAAGFALVPVVWQVAGALAAGHGVVLFRSEVTGRPTTYWAEALYQLHSGRQSGVRFDPGSYLGWYVARQGWPLSLLLAGGLALAALRRMATHLLLATMVAVPYAVYAFAPITVPRNLDAGLPFAALLAASALLAVARLIPWRRVNRLGTGVVVIVVCALATWAASPLLGVRSGFAAASMYVQQHGIESALVEDEVLRFYLRDARDGGLGCDGPRLPESVVGLRAAVAGGAQMAALTRTERASARWIARHARPLARFAALGSGYSGEDLIASENGPSASASHEWIAVYRLHGLFAPGAPPHPIPCFQDYLV